jgi:O-antigen/teichoic acid export membrane protein
MDFMNIKRRIFINTIFQIFGRFFSFILSFISVFLLTRYLGTGGYGIYSLVFSYLAFFGVISDMGLSLIMVRDLSKKTSLESNDINNFISVKFILTVFSILLSLGLLFFLPYSEETKICIVIATFAVSIGNLTSFGSSILQSRLRMDLVTLVDQITKLITVALIYLFVISNQSLYLIVSTVLIGNIFGFLLMVFFVGKNISLNKIQKLKIDKKIVREGILMGLLTLVAYSYFKVDSIILSFYRSSQEVGVYSLAYKIIDNITIFWGLYMASIFPLFSIFFEKNKLKYRSLFKKTMLIGIYFSIFFLIIGLTQGELLVRIFGGKEFLSSTVPLKILLFALPLLVVNNVLYHSLLSKAKVKQIIFVFLLSLLFNIISNFIFIPKYGYIAAAYNTVITEVLLTVLYVGVIKFFKFNFKNEI